MLEVHDPGHVRAVWFVVSAIGVAVLCMLAALYRRARDHAELEDAERIIAADERDARQGASYEAR